MNDTRKKIVDQSFDRLPKDLRDWINYAPFRIHDDYILRGEKAVRAFKNYVDNGGQIRYTNDGNNRN